MTLTVEDGTGLATADSYQSLVEFKAYCDARGIAYPSDDNLLEQAARRTVDFMVGRYRNRWKGYRRLQVQRLDWPRTLVEIDDVGGGYGGSPYYVPFNSIPEQVKAAQSELMIRALAGPLGPDIKRQKNTVQIGPLKVDYSKFGPVQTQYAIVDGILQILFTPGKGGVMASLVRA